MRTRWNWTRVSLLLSGLLVVAVNLVVDIIYSVLDPRIEVG